MEAKIISQRAVKNMINSNTTLLHIGNFETGKRTNLRRAVNECVYTSRLYYNTELQSDSEKIEYLSVYDTDRLFEVKLYETHIAAFNKYTEYHINCDATSKYYTLVISGMQFLIVSDMGWCNIYQVFDGPDGPDGPDEPDEPDGPDETNGEDKEYRLTVEFRNGQRYCYYGKTKKQAIAEFKRNFGNFKGFVKMERYNYFAAVKEDVLNYINENEIVVTSENRDEVEQELNDTLFTCDSVTGNASGSYTFNA